MCRVAVHALLFAFAVAASRNHGTDVIFTNEPCDVLSQGAKFRPVDGDLTRYKQCGPVGYFWILPCAPGTLFSMSHRSCVHPNLITNPPTFPTTTTVQSTTTTTTEQSTTTTTVKRSTEPQQTTTTITEPPGLVVFPSANSSNTSATGGAAGNKIPGLSPRLLAEFEEAMVDFMMNKQQLLSTENLSSTQPTPSNYGLTTTDDLHHSTPSTARTIASSPTYSSITLPLFTVIEQTLAPTTIRPQPPMFPNGVSSTVAEYGFAIVDDRSLLVNNNPSATPLPNRVLLPVVDRVHPAPSAYETLPPPQQSNEHKPGPQSLDGVFDRESSLVTPFDDRPLFASLTTTVPQTKVRLFRGCEIGTSCPFGSESNELFCYHPTDVHGYLHCSPGAETQGEWVERFCPDTLIFMGDRCENAVTSTDLQTSPPLSPLIHQVTMPPFTVTAAPPHQWQPEAPLFTRPPTIAPQAANGWTALPMPLPSKQPLFPRVHPFDAPEVMPRVRPPPQPQVLPELHLPLRPPPQLLPELQRPLPPPPQLLPELHRPLPPPPVALPHPIDSNAENELLHSIDALRSLHVGVEPPHSQQTVLPIVNEQMELAQRELIEKFRAVERLESQGHLFPGFPPPDFLAATAQTMPPLVVARFTHDLEPVARRIAEYLAAEQPGVLATLMQSPGAFTAAVKSPWARKLLPQLAGAAITRFARMKTVPLPDDQSKETDDQSAHGDCSQAQLLKADTHESGAFFMCVPRPTNSNQPTSNQSKHEQNGQWIRMLCPVGQLFNQAQSVCE